ncbi:hypothetical protein [Catellatospora sp. NPDC049609]|uniref:hypothetical protein n=1 Tax=Catellatospora sp. NPDC049609 TaxID=3155505 RepID=UPI003426D27D
MLLVVCIPISLRVCGCLDGRTRVPATALRAPVDHWRCAADHRVAIVGADDLVHMPADPVSLTGGEEAVSSQADALLALRDRKPAAWLPPMRVPIVAGMDLNPMPDQLDARRGSAW